MIERFELFTTAISQIQKSLLKIKTREMTGFSLKGSHMMCLFYLREHPEGLTAGQLSNMCAEDKAATSRTIAYLKERGFISEKLNDNEKKYRTLIFLQESGKSVTEKFDDMIISAVTVGGAGLSDIERKNFYHALLLIADNLKKYSDIDK